MNLAAVYHNPKSQYAYAYDRNTLHLRLRTARGDVQAVTLVGGDPFSWKPRQDDPAVWEWDREAEIQLDMQLERSTARHDYWFIALRLPTFRLRYAFILQCAAESVLYGSRDFYDLNLDPEARHRFQVFFNYPYLNAEDVFNPPAWVKDTVWYQIFPERFARGGSPDWQAGVDDGIDSFAGGNLQGICDHLDDIQALGANGLYLNPIFASPSTHKYDTTDYYHIDPAFGSNDEFGQLVQQAHRRGMRVMLDAVFNHCGWLHPFWQDVLKHGKASRYYDCFFIEREPILNFELVEGELPHLTPEMYGKLNFRTFGFVPRMPKWNTAHPLVREHLFGAVRYWMETFGVDGWRLDVSDEVSHDFWREFRKLVKSIRPDAYIMGEIWDNSYPWLMGDQFDAVMNYELAYPIWNLLGTPDTVAEPYDVLQYQQAINQLIVSYPQNNLEVMYNLVDCHDTARIAHVCGGNIDKVKLAYVLQMTFTGAPSIYYGSEVGLAGDDHHNRAPYPWGHAQNPDLRDLVKRLSQLRARQTALRSANLTWLHVDAAANTLVFRKESAGGPVYVFVNVNAQPQSLPVPGEIQHRHLIDLIKEDAIELSDRILLQPYGFRLLANPQATQI